MHAIAHRDCTNTVRVCAGSRLWGKKNPLQRLGLEPASALHLAFQLYQAILTPNNLEHSNGVKD